MNFDWYNLFSLSEFEATELVQRTLSIFLEGIGFKEILITKANLTAITYEGIFLPLQFFDANPFVKEGFACYLDSSGNVWLGIEVEE